MNHKNPNLFNPQNHVVLESIPICCVAPGPSTRRPPLVVDLGLGGDVGAAAVARGKFGEGGTIARKVVQTCSNMRNMGH